ncbi:hypothetical protein [Methylorubrum sp. POS3]|uniref:hypothetical protein n=1 Tax=Methylorubrum sp. POS3 TaxID=2998492 RepID=UPI003726B9A2
MSRLGSKQDSSANFDTIERPKRAIFTRHYHLRSAVPGAGYMVVLTRRLNLRSSHFWDTAPHVKPNSTSYAPNRRFRRVTNGGFKWATILPVTAASFVQRITLAIPIRPCNSAVQLDSPTSIELAANVQRPSKSSAIVMARKASPLQMESG